MAHEKRSTRNEEDGALLLMLMVGVAVMSIGVGVAAQAWSATWRRDNEAELIFRGRQYVDALMAYSKEHGGQYPTDLTELMKLGPRQLRYIRKLYRDPINPTGQWGLLYLMPGGQGIYDPVLAAKQMSDAANSKEGETLTTGIPGVTPIMTTPAGMPGVNPTGTTGAPPSTGLNPKTLRNRPGQFSPPVQPGALAGGGVGTTVGAPQARPASGEFSEEEPSEPPIGWPIVGVISRAAGALADKTFKVYKAHEHVNEWQFHVFERGIEQQQTPAGTLPRAMQDCGPGYGGKGVGCVGNGPTPGRQRNWPGPQRPFPGQGPQQRLPGQK